MPWSAFQQLNALLDDLAHAPTDGCLHPHRGKVKVKPYPVTAVLDAQLLPRRAPHLSASQRAASFLAIPDTSSGSPRHRLGAHARPTATSFGVTCKGAAPLGALNPFGPKDCSACGDDPKKCGQGSRDCMMYKDKCTDIVVGKNIDGTDIRMGEKYYYWGASRPFDSGDWLRYGTQCTVIEKGSGNSKPRTQMTEAEKSEKKEISGEKYNKIPWIVVQCDGNLGYNEVKLMNSRPPWEPEHGGPDVEPASAEAAAARLQHKQANNTADIIKGFGMQGVCDKMGRILTSDDGTFCGDNMACVTALPSDFAKDLPPAGVKGPGQDCWMWFTPECDHKQCPPPPYCPPNPPWKPGHKKQPPAYCPPPKKCTPPPPCEPPYWKDMCKANAGQPWCVSPEALQAYKGPIEIKCSATGTNLTQKTGSPDGCWWLNKNTRMDLQRLPGKVKRPYGYENKIFSKTEGQLDEEQARKWIEFGELPKAPKPGDNNEFLARAPPKEAAMA